MFAQFTYPVMLLTATCLLFAAPMVWAAAAEPETARRLIKLSIGKSAIIELDADVTDVIIGNPDIADAIVRTRRHLYLVGMGAGETNAVIIGAGNQQMLSLDIQVSHDLGALDRAFRDLLPASAIRTRAIAGSIVLTGETPTQSDAGSAAALAAKFAGQPDRVLNLLTVKAKQQVMLSVTVAEVNRSELQRLGIQWRDLGLSGGAFRAQGAIMSGFSATSGAILPALVSGGALAPAAAGASLLAALTGDASGALLVEALQRQGSLRILAEPNLTAISGETANFLAGGEFPLPVGRQGDQVAIEWKSFGVALSFTPTVLTEGRISMQIATEVSELSLDGAVQSGGFTIPGVNVRRVSSSVELPSGGAVVLAGLLSEETRKSADLIPGLSRVPVLGRLFESRDYTASQTELVVIVAPYLVTSRPRMALNPPGSFVAARGWQTSVLPLPPGPRKSSIDGGLSPWSE